MSSDLEEQMAGISLANIFCPLVIGHICQVFRQQRPCGTGIHSLEVHIIFVFDAAAISAAD